MIAHIVLNSHLDPVWRWKREQGIYEVLATAHSACGILDDYPDAIITRGEAWFYEVVEKLDPALFARIRNYVEKGRWKIVGNWYIQPDCNLASPETYLKHGEIAGKYFREKFGVVVKTGYNVDSFGHSAMLPSFYNTCGVENYIMMRPCKDEKALPANDFIWCDANGGRLTVSRVIYSYQTWPDGLGRKLDAVLAEANPELGHVLLMFGCGNHGCGPFRCELDWLQRHWNDYPGVEFRFSHPDAYFEAIKATEAELPVVTGELQHHAVGCYSIVSRIKREVRATENALIQRDRFLPPGRREELWKKLLFATFHDVLPGSAVESAYQDVYDDLGKVRSEINDAVVADICKRNVLLADAENQRMIFDNPGDEPFAGIVEVEPFFALLFKTELVQHAGKGLAVIDEQGNDVPWQLFPTECAAATTLSPHMAIYLEIPPRGRRILQAIRRVAPEITPLAGGTEQRLFAGNTTAMLDASGVSALTRGKMEYLAGAPEFQVIDDPFDTWGHFIYAYPSEIKRTFRCMMPWHAYQPGPLVGAALSTWRDDAGNRIRLMARTDAGTSGVQLIMRFGWLGYREMVKLSIPLKHKVERWSGGCPGGTVERPADGKEYPIFNRLSVECDAGHSLTLVSPDIFAADLRPDGKTLRLTLLRSTAYSYSADSPDYVYPEPNWYPVTDQGEFNFHLLLMPDATEEEIGREIYRFSDPVKYSELTRGIKIERAYSMLSYIV